MVKSPPHCETPIAAIDVQYQLALPGMDAARRSQLQSKWPIRNKLLLGFGLLLVIVVALSWSGFDGLYAYRRLVKNLERFNELPLATELSRRVNDLQIAARDESVGLGDLDASFAGASPDVRFAREDFRQKLEAVGETLGQYSHQLELGTSNNSPIGDGRQERRTVLRIEVLLASMGKNSQENAWSNDIEGTLLLARQLQELQSLVGELPKFLQQSIQSFPEEVQSQYRRRIALAWTTSGGTLILLGMFIWVTYKWIFRPLRILIKGSRKFASSQFDYRIPITSHDEMAELAAAMNSMTQRFQAIRDDLDQQVRERTKAVLRSEQLASVGFLAAGVAHEINDPLARIATCAQSLQHRLDEQHGLEDEPIETMLEPLRQIQEEAFRCKEITQSLLELSRTDDAERHHVDLRELVRGMVEMVRHVGRYQEKQIELLSGPGVIASVNAQQMKQVVLNLLTHGLDSLAPGGTVTLDLSATNDEAELVITDTGRGMTKAELAAVFQPSGPRRNGQGTGLGLAISCRIVKDHGGSITATSAGLGCGSQFRVCLPRRKND